MKLRYLIFAATTLFSTLFISCGNAQTPQNAGVTQPNDLITYKEWQEQAKTNIRLLPKYGNLPKTEKQKEADNKLIDNYVKQSGTRRKASEGLIDMGFKYLYRGDTKTAMYRFNQAWLLDSSNVDIYWGFGAVYHSLEQYELALAQYDEGLKIDPENSKIITDKATIYMVNYQKTNNNSNLKKAIVLFEQSYGLDSKNQNTLFKLSVSYFLNDDCKKAKKYYKECMALGGKSVTQEYTNALNEKCKD
jgi:tetratricopeptide (TPR) repeat protein